uniref:Ig-like domain-containing protein n=1 Tax=Gopherus agassizii TaxID=38772 RepID=A0A452HST1_9SAUR
PWVRHGADLLLYAEVGSVLFSPSLSAGPSATAQKSTLTLDPPWSIVFKGESVTLTCSTSHPPGRRFTWYRNNKVFRSTEINSLKIKYAQENDAGRYQCQIFPGGPNWLGPLGMDPVGPCCNSPLALDVSLSDWLILQVPYYGVFEGDPLCLRCYGWKGARVSRIRYYRDGADVTPSHVNSELSIKQARTRDSGKYHCTGSMKTGIMLTKVNSPTVSISVQGEEFLYYLPHFVSLMLLLDYELGSPILYAYIS